MTGLVAQTSPDYWFLEGSQIANTPAYTSGNSVVPLIDGAAYMENLHRRIKSLGKGDFLYFLGWRVTQTQNLLGEGDISGSLLDEFEHLLSIGVDVRCLIWYFPASALRVGREYSQLRGNIGFVSALNGLKKPDGVALLDQRLRPWALSSHHQKSIILGAKERVAAYVGGIDICRDRWDTPDHDSSPRRTKQKHEGWHDAHCLVEGPAVAQLWDNFRDRWNDLNPAHRDPFAPKPRIPPAISDDSRPQDSPVSNGTHHVQVLCTLAGSGVYSFAPDGEQSVNHALARAIDRSRHYIYIEDQFFWPCSLIERLREAAGRGVKIILLLANRSFRGIMAKYHNAMRFEALEQVRGLAPENVFVSQLQQSGLGPEIHVHAKLWIIDDRYVSIGSANVTQRSMATDSELTVAIVDGDTTESKMQGLPLVVGRFAKELRISLWTEHLGLEDRGSIEDPIEQESGRPAGWPISQNSSSGSPSYRHHAVCHEVPEPRRTWPKWVPRVLMNPG